MLGRFDRIASDSRCNQAAYLHERQKNDVMRQCHAAFTWHICLETTSTKFWCAFTTCLFCPLAYNAKISWVHCKFRRIFCCSLKMICEIHQSLAMHKLLKPSILLLPMHFLVCDIHAIRAYFQKMQIFSVRRSINR